MKRFLNSTSWIKGTITNKVTKPTQGLVLDSPLLPTNKPTNQDKIFLKNHKTTIKLIRVKDEEDKNFNEKRKSLGQNQPTGIIKDSTTISEQKQFDNLTKQIQLLEETNENISENLIEWKNAFLEKTNECEINREKYLQAQKLSEEYQRQLNKSTIDSERNQMNNLNDFNQKIEKEHFDEQFKEFGHLPFLLETKQFELLEFQSKYKVAERTIKALSDDLEACIRKCELLHNDAENEKNEQIKINSENENLTKEVMDLKLKMDFFVKENTILLKNVEKIKFLEDCLELKTKEIHVQCELLDKLKEENSKNISRIKERNDVQKRSFQSQINGLEQELMHLRSSISVIYKERDEMKQRMQNEIVNLEQKFIDSQIEIKNLRNHVDILKTSYTNMLEEFDKDDENDSG